MRVFAIALAVSTALLAAACSDATTPPQPNAVRAPERTSVVPVVPPNTSVDLETSPTVAEIKQRGVLLVGVPTDDPTFITRDQAGQYRGFDVEVARILAAGIGLNPNQVSFRLLPPTLRKTAVTGGSVDVQLSGFDSSTSDLAAVGPYAVTGSPGGEVKHYIGIRTGDDAIRQQLQRILDTAVADGSWQRAYAATLAPAGIPAKPR